MTENGMSDTPPTPQREEAAPPPPPADSPPPAPDAAPPAKSSNRSLMIVLSYLWILALIPLLVEKDDAEVQWHAKHGLVLTGAEWLLSFLLSATGVGCFIAPLVFVGFIVIRVMGIMKGVNGQRFTVPGLSPLADKF